MFWLQQSATRICRNWMIVQCNSIPVHWYTALWYTKKAQCKRQCNKDISLFQSWYLSTKRDLISLYIVIMFSFHHMGTTAKMLFWHVFQVVGCLSVVSGNSGGSKISQRGLPRSAGVNLLFWHNSCRRLHKNEKKSLGGGGLVPCVFYIRQWVRHVYTYSSLSFFRRC